MLENLTQGFRNARLKLQGKGRLDEANIQEAMREVRDSLLDGDVELGVVRTFVEQVTRRALGEVVALKSGKGLTSGWIDNLQLIGVFVLCRIFAK